MTKSSADMNRHSRWSLWHQVAGQGRYPEDPFPQSPTRAPILLSRLRHDPGWCPWPLVVRTESLQHYRGAVQASIEPLRRVHIILEQLVHKLPITGIELH